MNRILSRAAATAAGVGLLLTAAHTRAQLVYEPFSYTVGSSLDAKVNPIDGQPWSVMSNNVADDDILLSAGNVTYAGLAAPVGNSVSFASTGKSERLGFDQTVRAGTLYYSLAFRLTSLGSMTTGTPIIIAGFSDRSGTSGTPPTTIGARLYLRVDADSAAGNEKFNIGVSKNDSFNIAWDGTEHTLNTPIFVVGSYQVVGGGTGTDDVSKMWINPSGVSLGAAGAPGGELSAPVAGTDLTVSGAPSLAGFVLRQGTGVPSVQLDELRVDTNWARVTQPAGTTWTATDGSFEAGGNWSAGAPNSADAFANFGAQAAARTVTVSTPIQLRSITIDSPQGYTFAAAAGGAINLGGAGGVNVRNGPHVINTPVSLGGESLFSVATGATLSLNGEFNGNGNAVAKSGDGTLNLKHLRGGSVNLIAGATRVAADGGPSGTSKVTAIVVNAGASLDLSNNDLVIDHADGPSPIGTFNGSTYSGVTGQVVAGRNDGTWDGFGIRTSQPDASGGLTSLGVGDASSILGLGPGQTGMWSGQTVDDSSVLVRYTYAGDANLDGVVTGDDYSAIDFSILVPGTSGWANGDFNYDGVVTGDDYSAIDFGILAQGPSLGDGAVAPLGVGAVPEPGAVVALAASAIVALRRRRRRFR